MAVLESELRKLLRDEARFPPGTVSFCEWAPGGDAGIPDTWFNPGHGHCVPLELKRGPSVVKALRPSQRRWHRDTLELGAPTYGLTVAADRILAFALEIGADRRLGERLIADLSKSQLFYAEIRHLFP